MTWPKPVMGEQCVVVIGDSMHSTGSNYVSMFKNTTLSESQTVLRLIMLKTLSKGCMDGTLEQHTAD